MRNFLKIQMPKLHLQRFIQVWARVLASSPQVKTCEKTSLNSHQWHLSSFWQLRKGLIRLSLTDTSNQEIRSYITITFYQITVYRNLTYELNTGFAFSTHWWLLKAPYSRASETTVEMRRQEFGFLWAFQNSDPLYPHIKPVRIVASFVTLFIFCR